MKRILPVIVLFLASCIVEAQSVTEIKNSKEYLWGEGMAETYKEADQKALIQLVEGISVNVEGQFDNVIENVTLPGGVASSKVAMQAVMRTYSQATLTNTKVLTLSQEPNAHVIRYVSVNDVAKIFESRKNKAIDYVQLAKKAEENLKIDDVLRYYYWSYCLLKSVPDGDHVYLPKSEHLLSTWIPDQINEVLSHIKAQKVKVEDEFVTLRITYNNKPVASLDYTYFDGRGYTNIYSATDGIGFMEMQPGVSTDNLKFKCEYEYLGEAQIDKELAMVVEVMKGRNFRNAYINVEGDKIGAKPLASSESVTLSPKESTSELTLASSTESASYETIMEKVLGAVKTKNYASVEQYFTPTGKEMFHKLLNYGNARILEEPQLVYIKNGDEVICRSVPMCFSFKNNSRKFVENVCFTFNADRKINSLAFGLGEEAAGDIFKRTDYSEKARVVLTQFLENYKTAFALKRVDYIDSLFADNALIITGTVVKRTDYKNQEERTRFMDNKIIRYNHYSKSDYIKHLKTCFDSNEYVNIRFANNDIVRADEKYGEVYGIQIKQDYYSTNYGDTGYLFLYVDLNDPDRPIIKVRTWQPERDPNFGLYGLGDF